MADNQMTVTWEDSGQDPQCAPDPNYPDGMDLDASAGVQPSCKVDLPYPAKRIGVYTIICGVCGIKVMLTTAGRLDDPRSLTIPCRTKGTA